MAAAAAGAAGLPPAAPPAWTTRNRTLMPAELQAATLAAITVTLVRRGYAPAAILGRPLALPIRPLDATVETLGRGSLLPRPVPLALPGQTSTAGDSISAAWAAAAAPAMPDDWTPPTIERMPDVPDAWARVPTTATQWLEWYRWLRRAWLARLVGAGEALRSNDAPVEVLRVVRLRATLTPWVRFPEAELVDALRWRAIKTAELEVAARRELGGTLQLTQEPLHAAMAYGHFPAGLQGVAPGTALPVLLLHADNFVKGYKLALRAATLAAAGNPEKNLPPPEAGLEDMLLPLPRSIVLVRTKVQARCLMCGELEGGTVRAVRARAAALAGMKPAVRREAERALDYGPRTLLELIQIGDPLASVCPAVHVQQPRTLGWVPTSHPLAAGALGRAAAAAPTTLHADDPTAVDAGMLGDEPAAQVYNPTHGDWRVAFLTPETRRM